MKSLYFKVIILIIISLTKANLFSQTSNLLTNEFSNSPLGYLENERGDKIIDFSYAGYKGSGISLPEFDSVIDEEDIITLTPNGVDDTLQIQNAINTISSQSINSNGFRGGVLLTSGVFYISDRVDISTGGIIIKGSGGDIRSQHRTIIVDNSVNEWATFFVNPGGRPQLESDSKEIMDDYVAVGSFEFTVSDINNLNVGDNIIVNINPQQKWIDDQQYANVGGHWDNISFFQDHLKLERVITNINQANNLIQINSPITSSINKLDNYNFGSIQKINVDTRQKNIGFEDFILVSDYDCDVVDSDGYNSDENHAGVGIYFFNGKNGWAKNLTGFYYKSAFIRSRNYISSAENRWEVFWGLTVEDCAMFDGISLDTPTNHVGTREYYFDINSPSSLIQRCYGRNARHTYILNSPTNLVAFLDCLAEDEHLSSEPHQFYATGVLFDNVSTDGVLRLNAVHNGVHGQRAANSMIWNTTSYNKRTFEGDIHIDKPLNGLGEQWLIGAKLNSLEAGDDFYNAPNIQSPSRKFGTATPQTYYGEPEYYIGEPAHIEHIDNHVYPRSLYLRQLKDRLGSIAVDEIASATQQNLIPEESTIFDELRDKYTDIPDFMCPDDLINFYVEGFDLTFEDNLFGLVDFKILPNPVNSILKISGNTFINRITIMDITGKVLKIFKGNNSVYSIPVNNLSQGIYLIEAQSKNSKKVKKFIKI